MPKVQSYGPPKIVERVPTQQRMNEIPIIDTTAGLRKGIGDVATAYADIQKRKKETDAENALMAFNREKNDFFFKPQEGYFNTKGINAYDNSGMAKQRIKEIQDKYAEGLDGDTREAYMRASNVHITRGYQDIDRHAHAGFEAHEMATMDARVEDAVENGSLYYNNQDAVRLHFNEGRNALATKLERQGITGKAANEKLQNYDSAYYAKVIDGALAHDLNEANKLYKQYKDMLEGNDVFNVKQKMERANFDSVTESMAKSIFINNPGATQEELLLQVDNIKTKSPNDDATKKEVGRLVKNMYSAQQTAIKKYNQETVDTYTMQFEQGGIDSHKDIPGEIWWNVFNQKQRDAFIKREKDRAKGDDKPTDDVYFANLLLLPKHKLADINPVEHYDKVTGSDRDKLVSAVKAARKPDGDSDLAPIRTRTKAVSDTVRQIMGVKSSDKKYDVEQGNAIYRAIGDEIQAQEEILGRKLNPTELESTLHSFTRKYVEKNGGLLWGDKEYDLTDVPAEYVGGIVDELQRRNIPVNSREIINFYIRAKEKGLYD